MSERNERLWTIEAEIDRCMGEIGFLGSAFGGTASQTRIDKLSAVNREVEGMQIGDESPLLQSVLAFIKPELDKLIRKIIAMDFSVDVHWGKLKSRLDMFCATLATLAVTQPRKLGVLFTAIRDGIVEFKPKTGPWMEIREREKQFEMILNNIGTKLKAQHATFNEALPPGVMQRIANIEDILTGNKKPMDTEAIKSEPPWKRDITYVKNAVQKMTLESGSPLEAVMVLVKPSITSLLKTITLKDMANKRDTLELYQEIRSFQVISSFLSTHPHLSALFLAILHGIQATMPTEEEWSAYTTERRKRAFISCLKQVGTNIVNAQSAIMQTDLRPIQGQIYSVAVRLKNMDPEI